MKRLFFLTLASVLTAAGISAQEMTIDGMFRDRLYFGKTYYLPSDERNISADGLKELIYSNAKLVWRYPTRGDYEVQFLQENRIPLKLGEGFEPSRLQFAKFSPDSRSVAFVYKNNIYIESIDDASISQITTDGSQSVINGTFDWVYEEELALRDGFRWSNSGRYIAYWRSDTQGTGVFNMIDNIDSLYSKVIPLPYPKAGTLNSAVTGQVYDIQTGETRVIELPGDPRENYLARMDFIPGTDKLIIQQLDRLQKTDDVYVVDAADMSVSRIFSDHDDAFLNVNTDIRWIDKGKFFTWLSEKDGWRHLYKVSADGTRSVLLTPGEYDVISVDYIDTKRGVFYFSASPGDATCKYLYRGNLNGKGKISRITPQGQTGVHSYTFVADSMVALHRFDTADYPAYFEMVSIPDHKTIRVCEDNATVRNRIDSLGLRKKEFFRVSAGETDLDGWMIKPRDFDPSRKYPVIFYVYGEPASSTVRRVWDSYAIWSHFLSEQGYIVMSIDARGTNNPRGREFRKCIYGRIGDIAITDHANAVRNICKAYPFVDPDRIGVWGWSGGGTTTSHLMFKYPDIYKAGIAVAGVYNLNLYDTIYQERYMGLPSDNAQGYYVGSSINYADGLRGDFLMIHGTGDDNVHYQSFEMLASELQRLGKPFEMMSYPMGAHGIREREGSTVHLYNTMLRFWLRALPVNE